MSTRRDLQEEHFVFLTDWIFHALVVTLLCVVNCCPLVVTEKKKKPPFLIARKDKYYS